MVYVRHASCLRALLDRITCLLLSANKQDSPAAQSYLGRELLGSCKQSFRLKQIDEVDPTAIAVNKAAHLRVPATRLVAEVNASLQKLSQSNMSHQILPLFVLVLRPSGVALRTREMHGHSRAGPLHDSVGIEWL